MGVISSILVGVASTAAVAYVWYRFGFDKGRRYAIRQLFGDNCLRNDYGMYAEWDGLRNFWTIEVEHAEEADN